MNRENRDYRGETRQRGFERGGEYGQGSRGSSYGAGWENEYSGTPRDVQAAGYGGFEHDESPAHYNLGSDSGYGGGGSWPGSSPGRGSPSEGLERTNWGGGAGGPRGGTGDQPGGFSRGQWSREGYGPASTNFAAPSHFAGNFSRPNFGQAGFGPGYYAGASGGGAYGGGGYEDAGFGGYGGGLSSQGGYAQGGYGSQGQYGQGSPGGYGSASRGAGHFGYGQSGYGGGPQSQYGYNPGQGIGRYSNNPGGGYGYGGQREFGRSSDASRGFTDYYNPANYGVGASNAPVRPDVYNTEGFGAYSSMSEHSQRAGGGMSSGEQRRNRGPKGYTRSDQRIEEEICERLTSRGDIDPSEVSIEVKDGEVTLSGTVHDRNQKHRIEDLADFVMGVKDVHNRIRVERWSRSAEEGRESEGERASASTGEAGGGSLRSSTVDTGNPNRQSGSSIESVGRSGTRTRS